SHSYLSSSFPLSAYPAPHSFPTRRSSDLGPAITRFLVGPLGVANLLLVSAAFLAVCLFCIMRLRPWAQARERAHGGGTDGRAMGDRKSTRLNSSHVKISYAVFCLKKKNRI